MEKKMPTPPLAPDGVPMTDEQAKQFAQHVDDSTKISQGRQPDAPAERGEIQVVANRAGYFKGSRKIEGDKFAIQSMKELGSWMDLEDPKAEEARRKKEKDAKEARDKKRAARLEKLRDEADLE